MIKLNGGAKTKSDLNNNDLSTNSNVNSKDQFNEASIIHLTPSAANHIVSTQMPVISFPNSTTSTPNGNFIANRLNKSPYMQKLSSPPVTLPAIDANNNSDKSSSQ